MIPNEFFLKLFLCFGSFGFYFFIRTLSTKNDVKLEGFKSMISFIAAIMCGYTFIISVSTSDVVIEKFKIHKYDNEYFIYSINDKNYINITNFVSKDVNTDEVVVKYLPKFKKDNLGFCYNSNTKIFTVEHKTKEGK